jgi:16S rRNA processing protein RimM
VRYRALRDLSAGSLNEAAMTTDSKLILVGQVAGGFGVKGEVRVTAYTAEPITLLSYGVLLRADGSHALTVLSARPTKDGNVGPG